MKIQTIQLSSQLEEVICPYFGRKEDILFFDIESTGLSPKSASVYLIGTAGCENGSWIMRQWFAEDMAEEEAVLDAFLQYAAPFRRLVHFNGATFDIPFLQTRCRKYGLNAGLAGMEQLDIYRQISPWKNLLKLPNCKQKTLEEFLGIFREDPFNGGQLIQLYHAFRESRDERLLKVLLLHNADDIRGMISILPVLSYPALSGGMPGISREVAGAKNMAQTGPDATRPETNQTADDAEKTGSGAVKPALQTRTTGFQIAEYSVISGTDYAGKPQKELLVRLHFFHPLPVPLSCNGQGCFFSAEAGEGLLKIPVFCGELKYFYPDYKNYSYLPDEDNAIHKSVAIYVDKSHRLPATPETCYTRKEGEFLPFPGTGGKKAAGRKTSEKDTGKSFMAEADTPVFRKGAKEKEGYFLLEDAFLQDDRRLSGYVSGILSCLPK